MVFKVFGKQLAAMRGGFCRSTAHGLNHFDARRHRVDGCHRDVQQGGHDHDKHQPQSGERQRIGCRAFAEAIDDQRQHEPEGAVSGYDSDPQYQAPEGAGLRCTTQEKCNERKGERKRKYDACAQQHLPGHERAQRNRLRHHHG
jgi:hypothetical protein